MPAADRASGAVADDRACAGGRTATRNDVRADREDGGSGLVGRGRDPSDKRRVLLKTASSISEQASMLYRELGGMMRQELDGYSESEFELIMRFITRTGEALATSIKAL